MFIILRLNVKCSFLSKHNGRNPCIWTEFSAKVSVVILPQPQDGLFAFKIALFYTAFFCKCKHGICTRNKIGGLSAHLVVPNIRFAVKHITAVSADYLARFAAGVGSPPSSSEQTGRRKAFTHHAHNLFIRLCRAVRWMAVDKTEPETIITCLSPR